MPEEIQQKLIEEEMKESYLDYAMSVIVGRALPDVRDGLKPVHRRILYSMHNMGLQYDKPFAKSARIVGDCFKYHPHGDAAIYDTLVRMAQDFSLRYPLVKGHGNFGSIEGFKAAHMRYTESKLAKISEEMLKDIEKETVKFVDNFDNSLKEPSVLPSNFPNLLVNGSSGIAVGMATNIPPHNIKEIVDGIIKVIENPKIELNELMRFVNGPDFPTGGIIIGKNGIKSSYFDGRGKILLRGKTEVEEKKGRKSIIIKEIPYMVNKSNLIESIANLVRDKVVDGISDIRDESDRDGIRVVIELKKDFDENVILNQLYKSTQLQTTFGVINLALVDNEPKVLSLKELINYFILHRKDIIVKRSKFDLEKARKRVHILDGLKIALKNIDLGVKLIKNSKNVEEAQKSLIKEFNLSGVQAKAILEMRLQRLTSLEQNKLENEYKELLKLISELEIILASEERILGIIKEECLELKEKYGDERRTEIIDSEDDFEIEDLIQEEGVIVTMTNKGYVKRVPIYTYKEQKRGGKGVIATGTKEEDFVKELFITNTRDSILFFTDKGKVHWLKGYEIPSGSRYGSGKAIVNLLNLKGESVTTMIPVKDFSEEKYLVMVTGRGFVKRIELDAFSKPRKGGILGIKLVEDKLVDVKLTSGSDELIIGTKKGSAIRFNEKDVRVIGRSGRGVRGIRISKEDTVKGIEICENDLLTVTENGYGKRSKVEEYRLIKRGGKGVKNIKTSERNGRVVGIKSVKEDDEIMVITKKGKLIRSSVKGISLVGRNTQGVRIMKLDDGDKVIALTKVVGENGD